MKREDAAIKLWKSTYKKDVKQMLVEKEGLSNSEFSSELYDFLWKKYDWRDWLVVVYNDVWGNDNHKGYDCGLRLWRKNKRNVNINSLPRGTGNMNINKLTKELKRGSYQVYDRVVYHKPNCVERGPNPRSCVINRKGADRIYKDLPYWVKSRKCAVRVIRKSANPVLSYEERVVHVTSGDYVFTFAIRITDHKVKVMKICLLYEYLV